MESELDDLESDLAVEVEDERFVHDLDPCPSDPVQVPEEDLSEVSNENELDALCALNTWEMSTLQLNDPDCPPLESINKKPEPTESDSEDSEDWDTTISEEKLLKLLKSMRMPSSRHQFHDSDPDIQAPDEDSDLNKSAHHFKPIDLPDDITKENSERAIREELRLEYATLDPEIDVSPPAELEDKDFDSIIPAPPLYLGDENLIWMFPKSNADDEIIFDTPDGLTPNKRKNENAMNEAGKADDDYIECLRDVIDKMDSSSSEEESDSDESDDESGDELTPSDLVDIDTENLTTDKDFELNDDQPNPTKCSKEHFEKKVGDIDCSESDEDSDDAEDVTEDIEDIHDATELEINDFGHKTAQDLMDLLMNGLSSVEVNGAELNELEKIVKTLNKRTLKIKQDDLVLFEEDMTVDMLAALTQMSEEIDDTTDLIKARDDDSFRIAGEEYDSSSLEQMLDQHKTDDIHEIEMIGAAAACVEKEIKEITEADIEDVVEVEVEVDQEICQLMNSAVTEALSVGHRQQLLARIHTTTRVVQQLGLNTLTFSGLVEHNPLIAVDILLKMVNTTDFDEFLPVLIKMKMSVHSMEVVNRLTSAIELPMEFLHLFISNCISTCESIQDKYVQNRLVRLVCVFLQSLIRNRTIDFQELYIEIMTFCLEFSRIREATALYRLMKQLESEDSAGLQQALIKKLEDHPNSLLSDPALAKNLASKDFVFK